jgi:SAM-dependent methyltransferase
MARFWLRLDGEASACPGCASSRIALLDVFPIPRTRGGVSFLGGCRECGLLFANPLPSAAQVDSFYSETGGWAASQEARTKQLEAAHRRRLARTKPSRGTDTPPRPRDLLMAALARHVPIDSPPPAAKVLDFGCGDGKFLDRLQHRGWDTYGIEPSIGVAFLRHRRLDAPPQDRTFDLVFLHHVLEHVVNPLALLRQLAGAVREKGSIFVSVPRLDTLPEHRDFRYCINGRNHLVCFSEACLRGLLARAGFEVTARLDAPELDRALTDGKPMQLRLVATRTSAPPAPPPGPLDAAVVALDRYARSRDGFAVRVQRALPVRLRAALMNRARAR